MLNQPETHSEDSTEKLSLKEAVKEYEALGFSKEEVKVSSFEELRLTFNVIVAGIIGGSLWLLIIGVVCWNLYKVDVYSNKILSSQNNIAISDKEVERIEKAQTFVDNTAKSLYALLTPLATGVIAYYFGTQNKSKNQSDND